MVRDYCFRSITQNRTRTMLVVAGIALGAMLLTTVSALGGDMSRLLTRPLSRLYGGSLLVLGPGTTFGRLPSGHIGLRLADPTAFGPVQLNAVEAKVQPAAGFFFLDTVYTGAGHRVTLLARDVQFSGPHALRISRGDPVPAKEPGRVVMVNAGQDRYPVGSTVELHLPTLREVAGDRLLFDYGRPEPLTFTVTGHYQSPMALPGPMFIMPLATFREVTGVPPGSYMGVMAPVYDLQEASRVRDALDDYRVMDAHSLTASVVAGARFRESGGGFMAVSGVFAGVIILVSCLAMANTNLVVLGQRRLELGIMRSLGWRKQKLRHLLALECFILGGVGGALGYVLACVVIQLVLGRFGGSIWDLPGLGIRYGLAIAASAGAASVLSVLYAIFRISRVRPAEAIRGA
jgi:ABC-type antimicrobial peptide transport system permease subunit